MMGAIAASPLLFIALAAVAVLFLMIAEFTGLINLHYADGDVDDNKGNNYYFIVEEFESPH